MTTLTTALLIAAKDARQRLRDRSLFVFALALPLSLAFVFSLILGGVDEESEIFRYGVVNQDRGAAATAFTDQFLPAVEAGGVIGVEPVDSVEAGRRLVDEGEVAAVFVLPSGFSAAVEAGRPATLEVIGDVDAPLGVQAAQALADAYVVELTGVRLAVATATAEAGGSADPDRLAALAERAAAVATPVAVTDAAAGRRELDATTYTSAGMAVFFLFFTVQFGVTSLLEERQDGTMARLLAAPVHPLGVLGGKLLVGFGVGVVSLGLLAVATTALLGARWGDPVGVGLVLVAGALAATGIMALVASLADTAEQAGNWQTIIAVVLGTLGGSFLPVSQVGGALATLSYLTPHRWFLQGLADLAAGGGPGVVWPAVGALLAFAAVTCGVAVLRTGKLVRP
jgi:ABC-2 type transport system permease protein